MLTLCKMLTKFSIIINKGVKMQIKLEDFTEEERYSWNCPNCGEYNIIDENPEYIGLVCCDNCLEEFEIKE